MNCDQLEFLLFLENPKTDNARELERMLNIFIARGADVNLDPAGSLANYMRKQCNDIHYIETLDDEYAYDLDTLLEWRPLSIAAIKGHRILYDLLIMLGANPHLENRDGSTSHQVFQEEMSLNGGGVPTIDTYEQRHTYFKNLHNVFKDELLKHKDFGKSWAGRGYGSELLKVAANVWSEHEKLFELFSNLVKVKNQYDRTSALEIAYTAIDKYLPPPPEIDIDTLTDDDFR